MRNPAKALVVVTDGRRECMADTMQSANENLLFDNFRKRIIINDSLDPSYQDWLYQEFGYLFTISPIALLMDEKQGFSGAIQHAWWMLRDFDGYTYHLEEDFRHLDRVPLIAMRQILDANPKLAQVALMRQPVSGEERAAGGVYKRWGKTFTQQVTNVNLYRHKWVSHTNYFTTNPCMYPPEVRSYGWPDGPDSEAKFGEILKADGWNFGYFGSLDDEPRVDHNGIRTKDWKA